MSRDHINFSDPSTWKDEDDLEYVRQRIDRVPAEHRGKLAVEAPATPASFGESEEMARLRTFLEKYYPEDLAVEGQTPVGLAVQLLADQAGINPDEIDEDDETEDPGYEKWKADELTTEVNSRRAAGREIPSVKTKSEAAAALRADDATNGRFTA